MADISEQIVIGVVSGVITSAFLYLFVRVFRELVLPAIREILYQGLDVSGSWYWRSTFGSSAKMEITQKADVLTGVFTFVPVDSENSIKIFNLKGNVRDRFVQMTMQSADPKRLGSLSYLFEVAGDGNQLRGCCSFYSPNKDRIVSQDESFFRTTEAAGAFADSERKRNQDRQQKIRALEEKFQNALKIASDKGKDASPELPP